MSGLVESNADLILNNCVLSGVTEPNATILSNCLTSSSAEPNA